MTYVPSVCDAIDAIVTDIAAQGPDLGLPEFSTQKYAQPLWESAEMRKPLLAVYVWGAEPKPLDTNGAYTWPVVIRIGWFEPVPESLESLFVDETKARSAITNSERVLSRVQTYFATLPDDFPPYAETTITKVRWGKVRGGVYGVEIDVSLLSWQ